MDEWQKAMKSSEFVRWKVRFQQEWNEPTKRDYYLASIAAEIRRANAKNPERVHSEDLILKFQFGEPQKKTPLTDAEKQRRLNASKSFWLTLAGAKRK